MNCTFNPPGVTALSKLWITTDNFNVRGRPQGHLRGEPSLYRTMYSKTCKSTSIAWYVTQFSWARGFAMNVLRKLVLTEIYPPRLPTREHVNHVSEGHWAIRLSTLEIPREAWIIKERKLRTSCWTVCRWRQIMFSRSITKMENGR